jgi:CRISPR/Cas system-associated exonuclease Cas4 (RecB family)
MIFIPNQDNLIFEPIAHTYSFSGQKLTSVSAVISQYSTPFDVDGVITARKASENGLTIEEQKLAWKKIGDESRERGTLFHADAENYIKTKKIPNTDNKKLIKQFSKIKFKGLLFSETRLFNLHYGIAGTTDLIEVFSDNSISLADYKTNQAKKMSRFSFGRKMLYPLNYTFDSTLDKYEIQMSLYAYMLEEAGWWVKNLTIYHIDYDKQLIKPIPMTYRRKDVIRVLEHFKQNRK